MLRISISHNMLMESINGQSQLRRTRPFRQHAVAEAEQLGRAADGLSGDCASLLNELLLLDQAAKILLVHQSACKRFNIALQLQQGEFRRH